MDQLDAVREKLDIKILILYILRRLPGYIDRFTLSDLCQSGGVGYFDCSDCLADLVDNGNVEEHRQLGYRITEKGARNVDAVESSLPFSIRKRAQELLAPVARHLERASMIEAKHYRKGGALFVELAMADGKGEVIRMRFLAGNEDHAELIEKNFRENAEKYYDEIVSMMSKKEDKK